MRRELEITTTMTPDYMQRAREIVDGCEVPANPGESKRNRECRWNGAVKARIAQALADAVAEEREACELLLLHARNEHLRLKAACLETPDAKPMAVMQQIRAEECDALAEALRQRGEGTS